MKFCDKLIQLRREKGYSQEQLADMLNVSRQSVSKWEAGQSMPELNKLIIIADRFGTTIDNLVRDEMEVRREVPYAETQPIPYQPVNQVNYYVNQYEYKSKLKIFGLPLVHINMGYGLHVAKGIIAIGNVSIGVISIGGIALGGLSFGGVALGLLAALGGVAIGGFAFGGLAVGILAVGGAAFGLYSLGGLAVAKDIAVGSYASGHTAIGVGANGDNILKITDSLTNVQVQDFILEHHPHIWKPILKLLSLFSVMM